MSITLVFDLEKYPAFSRLSDPGQTIQSIVDKEHAIMEKQQNAFPTTHFNEMLDIIRKTSESSTCDIQRAMERMQGTNDRMQHSATEIRSTGEIVRSNVSELKHIGTTLMSTMSEFKAIQEALKELPILLSKSQTKGSVGEVCVSSFLKEILSPGDFTIESTSSASRSGDIRVTRRDFECMIDSKFYKQTVPKKEVEKLRRDMNERKVRCGVLLSLTSGVSGFKSVDMDVYTDEHDKLACILVLSDTKDKPERILVGMKMLELVWEFFMKKNPVSNSSLAIRDKSVSVLQNILDSSEDLRDLTKQYEKHKKVIFEGLSSFHEHLVKTVERHVARVQEKLNVFAES
jgi:hypothetical protein